MGENVLLAGVPASGVERTPLEAHLGRDVEGLRGPGTGTVDEGFPPPDRVVDVDGLDATVGTTEEELGHLKGFLKSILELVVAHPRPSWLTDNGSRSITPRVDATPPS
jgi:hypothetical protein